MNPHGEYRFGDPLPDRPYTVINMVSTFDGKILTGERDEPVMDLGSKTDHAAMRALEEAVDGILIGAGSLRATPGLWYPGDAYRFVVTTDPHLPTTGRFFTDKPEKAIVVGPDGLSIASVTVWYCGSPRADLTEFARRARTTLGIKTLLVEGGSELNADMLRRGLVDEVFLTLTPKLKLGQNVPTIAGGEPFSRAEVETWNLVSVTRVQDELFLRYRK